MIKTYRKQQKKKKKKKIAEKIGTFWKKVEFCGTSIQDNKNLNFYIRIYLKTSTSPPLLNFHKKEDPLSGKRLGPNEPDS